MSERRRGISLPQLSILSFDPTANAADKKKGAPDEAGRPKDIHMQTYTTAERAPHSIANTVTVGKEPEVVSQEYQRTQTWLNQKLDVARRNIFTELVVITPVLADLILRRNPDNRGIRAGRLAEIRSDLENGNFVFNGETIIVSKEGYLNDGQHRLMAVRDSGVSLKSVVVFGVPRTSRLTVDQGTARTSADYLGMSGRGQNAMIVASVARLIWQFRKFGSIDTAGSGGSRARIRSATKSEIVGIAVDREQEIARSLLATARCGKWMGSRSLIGFCHWVFARTDHNAATEFFDRLIDGAVAQDQPIYTLRQRMISEPTMKTLVRFEAIVRTWNAMRKKQSLGKIMIMGRIPKVEA